MTTNEPQMQMPEGFEDPNYGGSSYENWSLKEDSTELYRILPAMKSLTKVRDYSQFWYTHWWKGRSIKGDDKLRSYPILCHQERVFSNGSSTITKECPLCQKRDKHKAKVAEIEAIGRSKGASKIQLSKALAPYVQWLKDHGHDGKYRVYAINKSGQFGVLRLTPTCMRKLRAKVKALIANGLTPMGVRGVWWEFSRTGTGFNTEDEVHPHRIERDDGSSIVDFHILDKATAVTALSSLPDFSEEIEKIRYSAETMQAIASSNDDPDEVTKLLGLNVEAPREEDLFDGVPEDAAAAAAANPPSDDPFGDIAPVAAPKPVVVAAAAPKPVAATPAPKPVVAPAEPAALSDEDFAAEFANL